MRARCVAAARAGRSGARVALLVLVLGLAGAPAAAEPAVWLKSIDVAGGAGGVADVAVAMNGGGDAVVVWHERHEFPYYRSVHASIRSRGVFTAPAELSPRDAMEPRPQAALDAAGNALVLWQQDVHTIQLARRPAGAGFGAPVKVDGYDPAVPGSETAHVPNLVLAPAGNALIAWTTGSSRFALQVADVSTAGVVGPRTTLSQPDDSDGGPRVAFGPSGEALLAWNDINAGYVATAALRAPGDVFSTGVPLSDSSRQVEAVRGVIDADGDAIVSWIAHDGSNYVVQAALRSPGGDWSAPVPLSDPAPDIGSLGIATGGGTTTVVWTRLDGVHSTVQAAKRPPSGVFGVPVDLSDGKPAVSPDIAAGGDGTTIATWSRCVYDGCTIQAAIQPPGEMFRAPANLSPTEQYQLTPRVAIGHTGDALVVWNGDHSGEATAEVAAYDASPPRIDGVSIPSMTNAGAATHMSVAASDISSPVTTTWSFGDGSVAEGNTVKHAYEQPGTYEVRVTATDAAGRTAVATRRITVDATRRITVAASPPQILTAPFLSRWSLRPAAFCVADSSAHVTRTGGCRGRTGSHMSFRLDAIAKVSFTVERRTPGRRVDGRCISMRRTNRSAKPCARYVPLHGHFTRWVAAGDGSLSFTGRLHGHALAPGSYALVATPSVPGARGRSVRTTFHILSGATS